MSTTSSVPMLDSKSAKKRKTKTQSSTPPVDNTATETSVNGDTGNDAQHESNYLKELAKNIRNINKKLAGVSKTETTLSEHPGVSLDELVAQRKINADQKAQILKKPQLETQLAQLQEQQKNLAEFAQELEARHAKEKSSTTESHASELARVKAEAEKDADARYSVQKRDALKLVCGFLHAAAYKRQTEGLEAQEHKAYEGVLFHLYQGNEVAHDAIINLVEGADQSIRDPTSGEDIDYTYAQLQASVLKEMEPAVSEAAEAVDEKDTDTTPKDHVPESDPTIVNAGLTELEDTTTIPVPEVENSPNELDAPSVAPEQASTTDAGNAVAEAAWNGEGSTMTEATQNGEDWVQVHAPRDLAETETGSAAPPAEQASTSNWADEAVAAAEEKGTPATTSDNDGFSEVKREQRGRGRGGHRGGRGGFEGRGRGRGRGGENRGRGGRGRGGPRGTAAPQAAPSAPS